MLPSNKKYATYVVIVVAALSIGMVVGAMGMQAVSDYQEQPAGDVGGATGEEVPGDTKAEAGSESQEPEAEIEGSDAEERKERYERASADLPVANLNTTRTYENPDPTGQAGSGNTTAIHRTGGEEISAREERRQYEPIPDARIYRLGETAWEPTLGLTSNGTIYYKVQPVRSNTDPEVTYTNSSVRSVTMRSTDGGVSWRTAFDNHPTSLDPLLYVDRATDRVFTNDYEGPCHALSYTDDGADWNSRHVGCAYNTDHQTIFTGPPRTSDPEGYPNLVYLCSIGSGVATASGTSMVCSKSLDGGDSFAPTGEPAFTVEENLVGECGPGNGHGYVGPDGTVYLPAGYCGQPYLAISHDEGETWNRVQVADNGMFNESGGFTNHEAAVVADESGNVYYMWIAEDRKPYLAISRDKGVTWSEPMMIGAPGLNQTSLPTMMKGPNDNLAFAYMGSENAPAGPPFPTESAAYENVTWNGYITLTTNALDDEPVFYSASVNNPDDQLREGKCGPVRCNAVGDFIDIQVGPNGQPWAAFSDACSDGVCYDTQQGEGIAATLVDGPNLYEGEGCSRYQQDPETGECVVDGDRTDDGSVFTTGQTNRIDLDVRSTEEGGVRDAVPTEWNVLIEDSPDVERVEQQGDVKYVYFTENVSTTGTTTYTYFVETPKGSATVTGPYTFGPAEIRLLSGWTSLGGTMETNVVVGRDTSD
jgi:hypothetical protein